ncbi:acetaldehyde dehydrogenase (acetylating) [Glaciimonas soli]|uniref:Acetaldehyde dehydrogenase n=1 Tax=Glaciimonas soli TaxID=2590999 RepID=A0A843YNY9_9BURK|nr:acetaldehyde dehydrogenase (acetylating) [Glaciimonas soli]MQQ99100.1 acetaldehyde dehydrogenase (acetylating) [Glaciimonas soli]
MSNASLSKTKVGIIGPGNIGIDLMMKVIRLSKNLEMAAMVGTRPASEGLKRATQLGIPTSASGLAGLAGLAGLLDMPEFAEIDIVFDATSANAHHEHNAILQRHGKRVVDLTPAAIGPFTIPALNGDAHLHQTNVNMVTCGGQATIPIVAAVSSVSKVHYAEIIASVSSKSVGPGTRANIDEFVETTSKAIESVGGALRGKAMIIINPSEPPMIMRDTVHCLCDDADESKINAAIQTMVAQVQSYVPGYRLKQTVQFTHYGANNPLFIPEMNQYFRGIKVSVFLEVEGAGHYLAAYAGNLDIMTSAALKTAERMVEHLSNSQQVLEYAA